MALYEGLGMSFVKMSKYLPTNKYQNKDKPDAVLTSGFWHFTRRGEKLGIRNGTAGKSSWQGLNLL